MTDLGSVRLTNQNFLARWIKGILGPRLLSFQKLGLIDKLLLEHVDYPTSLFLLSIWSSFGWMSEGGHSKQLLFFALFCQSTPSCLKVMGWVGGPCDYCVSPIQRIGFLGILDLV